MALSKKRIEEEIKASGEAIKTLKDTIEKCKAGIEVNEIVLGAFEARLSNF